MMDEEGVYKGLIRTRLEYSVYSRACDYSGNLADCITAYLCQRMFHTI